MTSVPISEFQIIRSPRFRGSIPTIRRPEMPWPGGAQNALESSWSRNCKASQLESLRVADIDLGKHLKWCLGIRYISLERVDTGFKYVDVR